MKTGVHMITTGALIMAVLVVYCEAGKVSNMQHAIYYCMAGRCMRILLALSLKVTRLD